MNIRKSQAFTLVEIMIVVVIIGLLAGMAIPAFKKVRSNAQDKGVTSNLRLLAAAADQYYLETGNTTVNSSDLVGTNPTQKVIQTVANETYSAVLTKDTPVTASGIAGQRTLSYTN